MNVCHAQAGAPDPFTPQELQALQDSYAEAKRKFDSGIEVYCPPLPVAMWPCGDGEPGSPAAGSPTRLNVEPKGTGGAPVSRFSGALPYPRLCWHQTFNVLLLSWLARCLVGCP